MKYLSKDKLGSRTIFLNDLRDWSNKRAAIPDEENKMFVGTFEYETPSTGFRIFLTTKRLISFAKYVNTVQSGYNDSGYNEFYALTNQL